MRIVFFGTPEFAVASLRKLQEGGHDIAAVVTAPDKPAGRGHHMLQSDVKKYALEAGLPLLQPAKLRDPEFLQALRDLQADLFVVIAFRMLPEAVWAMPPRGTFNLHGSLLPRYRGAAPINRAVMAGDTETGVTTFFLKHDIDTGDIIMRRSIPIGPDDTAGDVHDRLMELGAEMTLETVNALDRGKVETFPQPEGDFIAAPKIFREDCLIDWERPASAVHNQIRGLAPYPSAWSVMVVADGRHIETKVSRSRLASPTDAAPAPAGTARIEGRRLFVTAADGWVELLELQPAGKKRMNAEAFLLGYKPDRFCRHD